jgi:diguanylate cyclase (GGDEF)-like protein/PAS domain S-box-containing protein
MTNESPRRDVAFRRPSGPSGAAPEARVRDLASLLDASPVGVGLWSAEGELLHANPVLTLLLGEPSTEERRGRRLADVVDPDDGDAVDREVDRLWRGDAAAFECRMRCTHPVDGTSIDLPARVFGVFTDTRRADYLISIVDFVPAGSPYERLADDVPVMLWLADARGVPGAANPATITFLGIGWDDPIGAAWWARVHPDDVAALRDAVGHAVDTGAPIDLRARLRRHDGEWRLLWHRATPIVGDAGLIGFAGASIDVTEQAAVEDELAHFRRLFESITEAGPVAVAQFDGEGRLVYTNRRWSELLGELVAVGDTGWRRLLPPDQLDELLERAAESRRTGRAFPFRVQADVVTGVVAPPGGGRPGQRFWADLRVAPVADEHGAPDGWVVTLNEVTSAIEVVARADHLARVLDAGSDFLMITERNGALTYVNSAAQEVLGVRAVAGDPSSSFLMDVLDAESNDLFHDVVEPILMAEGTWRGELTFRRRGGGEIPVSAVFVAHTGPDGRIESLSAVARDISDLKQAQGQMLHLATHDYLTGLPNRLLLYDRLEQALARHRRYDQPVALLFVDLDRFKPVNDEHGHQVGDAVLVAVAERIRDVIRETDTAARLGGDEFAVLVEGISDLDLLERIGRRLIAAISEPVAVEGVEARIGASIGLVPVDRRITDADALIAAADATMYQAKARGRGRVAIRPSSDEP